MIKATTPRLKRWRHGTRRTLAKQIRQLAQTDALAASLLAERGKQFSEIETLLYLYYETLEQFRKIKAGQKTTDEKLLATGAGWTKEQIAEYRSTTSDSIQNLAFQISQILIDAIGAHDSGRIMEIANAVDSLKTKRPVADSWRSKILMNRHILERRHKQWTIREWAKFIGWPDRDKNEGFTQLRRLLKELDAPLKPTR